MFYKLRTNSSFYPSLLYARTGHLIPTSISFFSKSRWSRLPSRPWQPFSTSLSHGTFHSRITYRKQMPCKKRCLYGRPWARGSVATSMGEGNDHTNPMSVFPCHVSVTCDSQRWWRCSPILPFCPFGPSGPWCPIGPGMPGKKNTTNVQSPCLCTMKA